MTTLCVHIKMTGSFRGCPSTGFAVDHCFGRASSERKKWEVSRSRAHVNNSVLSSIWIRGSLETDVLLYWTPRSRRSTMIVQYAVGVFCNIDGTRRSKVCSRKRPQTEQTADYYSFRAISEFYGEKTAGKYSAEFAYERLECVFGVPTFLPWHAMSDGASLTVIATGW